MLTCLTSTVADAGKPASDLRKSLKAVHNNTGKSGIRAEVYFDINFDSIPEKYLTWE